MSDGYTMNDAIRDAAASGDYVQHEFPTEQRCILGSLKLPEVRRAPLRVRIRYAVADALHRLADKIERN